MIDIKAKLKQLKDLDAHLDIIKMDKAEAVALVLTDEIKAQLNDIDEEFDEILEAIRTTAATLEADVKAEVLAAGASIKKGADHYGVSFVKGRISWDTTALDGYSAAHPEIDRFKKIGQPSARINKRA